MNDILLKQSKKKFNDLNLREIILLDNQSTMSLFCNERMVSDIKTAPIPLTLKSNGGTMQVNKVASIGDGKPKVWFLSQAITNILSLKEVTASYHVTYDSYNKAFIVWREEHGLPNWSLRCTKAGYISTTQRVKASLLWLP